MKCERCDEKGYYSDLDYYPPKFIEKCEECDGRGYIQEEEEVNQMIDYEKTITEQIEALQKRQTETITPDEACRIAHAIADLTEKLKKV